MGYFYCFAFLVPLGSGDANMPWWTSPSLVQAMACHLSATKPLSHYDAIKWKHYLRYCPFVWGIHQSPLDSPHKGTVMQTFDLFCQSEQDVKQTLDWAVIQDAMMVIWHRLIFIFSDHLITFKMADEILNHQGYTLFSVVCWFINAS